MAVLDGVSAALALTEGDAAGLGGSETELEGEGAGGQPRGYAAYGEGGAYGHAYTMRSR